MNSGQMLITIAAISLIVLTILNFNKSSLNTQENLDYNKEYISTVTAAQSLLDEISGKAYDENIINGASISSALGFSSTLAPESGEAYPNFDDIDDFNNFSKKDSIMNLGIFNFKVKINYVNDNLENSSSCTYHKKVTIKVTDNTLKNPFTNKLDTIQISTVLSQWKML